MCILRQLHSHICASFHTAPEPMTENCSLWMLMTRHGAGWGKERYNAIGRLCSRAHHANHNTWWDKRRAETKECGLEPIHVFTPCPRLPAVSEAELLLGGCHLPFILFLEVELQQWEWDRNRWVFWESWHMYLTALSLIQNEEHMNSPDRRKTLTCL